MVSGMSVINMVELDLFKEDVTIQVFDHHFSDDLRNLNGVLGFSFLSSHKHGI